MEVPLQLSLITTVLLALIITLFVSKKSTQGSTSTNSKPLPQPPGAWPLIGHLHLLGGQDPIFRTLGAMADECGPIFSLCLGQHRAIVMSSWEVVKDCFTNNDAIIATRPNMVMSKYLFYNFASFAISPYGNYWRDMRKISTFELLSTKRLEKTTHIRAVEVNLSIKNLYKECGQNLTKLVSLNKWFECLGFNIALAMIVGKRFDFKLYDESDSFASRFKKAIGRATYLAGVPVPSDFVPWLEQIDLLRYIKSMKEVHKEIDLIIGDWLDEHIQRRKEHQDSSFEEGDFLDVLLSNISEDCVMSGYSRETIIKATAQTLLLTGSESTSITLIWAISLLLNHQKALKAAQKELDLQVGQQRWIEESDIANLPYLQAIIKETLRLYPPSPLTGPREAMEDCHIGGHVIPKGTRLIVNIWKLHRDPRVWAEPNQFRPERFLDEHGGIEFRRQHFEYIPFSLGRRSCPGMNFGLQVVQLTLARLVQGFDLWAENGGPVDMTEGVGLALTKAGPVNAFLKPRLPPKLYEAL